MAKSKQPQRPVLPSVLDRLFDDAPSVGSEPAPSVRALGEALRDAVRRDLEHLLNTRQRCKPQPGGLEELEASSFEYGIPDLTGTNLTSKGRRKRYLRDIEELIKRFEPRFASVKVTPLGKKESLERGLEFRIDAVLRVEPAPESVLYDSQIDVLTRSFRVKI